MIILQIILQTMRLKITDFFQKVKSTPDIHIFNFIRFLLVLFVFSIS